jgi:hypothetical protein
VVVFVSTQHHPKKKSILNNVYFIREEIRGKNVCHKFVLFLLAQLVLALAIPGKMSKRVNN